MIASFDELNLFGTIKHCSLIIDQKHALLHEYFDETYKNNQYQGIIANEDGIDQYCH